MQQEPKLKVLWRFFAPACYAKVQIGIQNSTHLMNIFKAYTQSACKIMWDQIINR